MPRYYFDVEGSPTPRDPEGEEYATLEDAKRRAIEITHQLANARSNGGLQELEIIVRDESGEVFRVQVSVAQ